MYLSSIFFSAANSHNKHLLFTTENCIVFKHMIKYSRNGKCQRKCQIISELFSLLPHNRLAVLKIYYQFHICYFGYCFANSILSIGWESNSVVSLTHSNRATISLWIIFIQTPVACITWFQKRAERWTYIRYIFTSCHCGFRCSCFIGQYQWVTAVMIGRSRESGYTNRERTGAASSDSVHVKGGKKC